MPEPHPMISQDNTPFSPSHHTTAAHSDSQITTTLMGFRQTVLYSDIRRQTTELNIQNTISLTTAKYLNISPRAWSREMT